MLETELKAIKENYGTLVYKQKVTKNREHKFGNYELINYARIIHNSKWARRTPIISRVLSQSTIGKTLLNIY
jgi:hypothetical protein